MPQLQKSLPDLETVFMETPDTPALCVHRHRPDGPPRAGLLICRPMIADIDANEHREVLVARGCVGQGVAVNRFFHRGTGDSYGDFAEASFADLVADAELALADLHRDVGAAPIAVLGSRLGALVAASLAHRHDLDLVLWDPVTVPARHVKELLRMQMMHLMKVRESGYTASALRAALDEGELIDIFGWDFPGSVFRSLADELDAAIPHSGGSDRSVFLLTTQDHGEDVGALVPAGVTVERHEIETRDPMWLANFDLATAEASLAMVDQTVDWVASTLVSSDRAVALDLEAPLDSSFASGPRETPLFLDAGDENLAAYLTEPGGKSNGQGLVMMPGAGHGTAAGPNRLWTRLARQLADDGYTVLRFTYRSISNSTGDKAVFDLAAPLVDDARAAVDAIRASGVDEVSLLGWCYGGIVATAVADAEITRVILLSPSSRTNTMGIRNHTDQRAENMGTAEMVRSVFDPSKWRSLSDPAQRRTYKRMIAAKGRQLWKGKQGAATSEPGPSWLNHNWLDDLEGVARDTDTEIRIMFGRDDTDHRDYQTIRGGRISEIFAVLGDRLEIHRSNGSIHQLHTPAAQEAAMVTVGTWMDGVRVDSPTPSTAIAADTTAGSEGQDDPTDVTESAQTELTVSRILLEQLGLTSEEAAITGDSSLLDEVGLDSVALIRFAMGLENEFNIEIDDDDLIIDNFGSTRRVAAYIQGRLDT